jgi:hypothetical protein
MDAKTNPTSLKSILVTQLIASVVFVGIPVLLTFMAPLSSLGFQKTEQGMKAEVDRYLLMVIPWKHETLVGVQSVKAEITAEKRYRGTAEERRKGQKGVRLATGQIVIVAGGMETKIQTDPELAKRIEKEFAGFQQTESANELSYEIYASWWLSYVLGGIATGLAVFYVFGATAQIILSVTKKLFASSVSVKSGS